MPHSLTLAQLADTLKGRDRFLILTHRRPDGDTIGSAAALCRLLRQMGKIAHVAPNEEVTARYGVFLDGLLAGQAEIAAAQTRVAVDIADESLLCPSMDAYRGRIDLCVDHHPSNRFFAGATHVRAEAGAAGEIIWQLAGQLELTPDIDTLAAIYLAVLTDTGCFLYSNTTPLCHTIAAACMQAGVDFAWMNTEFVRKKTRARFLIERTLLDGLVFGADGAVAGAFLTRSDIDAAGADPDDLDNLASLIIALEGVACAVLATENADGVSVKISVRTRAPLDGSALCAQFGGGGHARAAGCTLTGSAIVARDRLMEAAGRALSEGGRV